MLLYLYAYTCDEHVIESTSVTSLYLSIVFYTQFRQCHAHCASTVGLSTCNFSHVHLSNEVFLHCVPDIVISVSQIITTFHCICICPCRRGTYQCQLVGSWVCLLTMKAFKRGSCAEFQQLNTQNFIYQVIQWRQRMGAS